TLDPGCVVDPGQQVREASAAAVSQIILVAVHRLAQECHLPAPFRSELAYLDGGMLTAPALVGPANRGHNTIRAELIAADHDAHVGLKTRWPHGRVPERVVTLEAPLDLQLRAFLAVQTQCQLRPTGSLHFGDEFRQVG